MIATEIFDILLLLALAIALAKILGHVFDKLKQPAVIGEILAGVVLGGLSLISFSGQIFSYDFSFSLSLLNFDSEEFKLLAEIGILFMLFISGLQTNFYKLKKMEKASSFVAVGGVLLPLLLGFLVSLVFFSVKDSIIIGLILTATSVGVTVRTLIDMHKLNTDVGATILGGAVIDDILGIILLAFVLGIGSLIEAVWIGVRIAMFFLVFLYIGLKVIDKILDLGEKIHLPKAFLSISISILLLYSFFAYKAGIAGIIGAFVAGILIGQNVRSRKIVDDVEAIGYGFFIPLFFVWIGASLWMGTSIDISHLTYIGLPALLIIVVAIAGKMIGCGIGAKISGMKNIESLQIGVGMIPRME
ncbi:MAG: cation:proton antiporter, partial [Thermoplasmatales archaeon]